MDWDRYKALCDRPDHWSRWMLDECADLLMRMNASPLAGLLRTVTAGVPLDKPADHRGPSATDMYRLELIPEQRAEIAVLIKNARRQGLTTTGGRDLGGFDEAWQEYVEFVGQ